MLAIGALWPVLMLLALALLGRGRSPASMLVLALAVIPALVLMGSASKDRFLFEVRYFSGAVPMLILLSARDRAHLERPADLPVVLVAVALTATFFAGNRRRAAGKEQPPRLRLPRRAFRPSAARRGRRHVALRACVPQRRDRVLPRPASATQGGRDPTRAVPKHGRVFLLASFPRHERRRGRGRKRPLRARTLAPAP